MKIQPMVWTLSILLSGILTLGAGLLVRAQDVKAAQQQPPAQAEEFDRGQIESFASAARQVGEIRLKWQSRLQAAGDADQAQELQSQAKAEMRRAVEDEGLTVETYNAIAAAAQQNPELAMRISELLERSP